MSRWYIIKGLGPAFDGLIVKADHAVQSWRIVEKIINRNIIFGDREFSVIIPESGVMIREKFLKQIDEPMFREFANTNPWGKFISEGREARNGIVAAWAQFDNCIQVTISEKQGEHPTKTLFSDHFMYTDCRTLEVIPTITEAFQNDESLENLIFTLKELKSRV